MKLFSVCSIHLFLGAVCAHPQLMAASPPGQDEVEIMASGDSALGTRDAASQGFVGASVIKNKPLLRPADVLEFVPGMVVTQHSGDGKANQYFLRGMNLDHGTDFATTVNGVPVKMLSHAHGQGYSDLNFLMPELVQRIDYRKGPYFAGEGDFSSAGSARIAYRTRLDQPFGRFDSRDATDGGQTRRTSL
jgi:outer membrane receptor for ferrienterochelin and colicin